MKLLAIDTASSACSAALLMDNALLERYEWVPRGHTRLILPMVQSLMAEAGIVLSQLDALAFGCGPGSFTGIRIAAGVVQGIAFAIDRPVIPVSSLLAMAQSAYRTSAADQVIVAIDARMDEIYWGAYSLDENDLMQVVLPEALLSPTQAILPDERAWIGIGDAWKVYDTTLQQRCARVLKSALVDVHSTAQDVARLAVRDYLQGKVVSAEQALPIYLREHR